MKATKAREILQVSLPNARTATNADYYDAIKLSIEALKRHQERFTRTLAGMMLMLSGETPEDE